MKKFYSTMHKGLKTIINYKRIIRNKRRKWPIFHLYQFCDITIFFQKVCTYFVKSIQFSIRKLALKITLSKRRQYVKNRIRGMFKSRKLLKKTIASKFTNPSIASHFFFFWKMPHIFSNKKLIFKTSLLLYLHRNLFLYKYRV